MGICKFFMEGYCKFGHRCKYEHVDPYRYDSQKNSDYASERPQGTSILKAATTSFGTQEFSHAPQQSFGNLQQHGFGNQTFEQSFGFNSSNTHQMTFAQKPSGMKYNIQEIMQVILRDITQLERGGQWLLSCYCPIKDLPNIPGLEDNSPDELRWEFYKALQNGSLPLCQAIVQQLSANVAKINNELKRKDSGYAIIDRWIREGEQSIVQNAPAQQSAFSPFGGASSTNTQAPFSSPFYSPNEPQPQPLQQTTSSSFAFTLSQQQTSPVQSLQRNTTVFPTAQRGTVPPDPVTNELVYSAIDVLSETEINAFQADRFVLGSIPTKPPPKIFCNL